jgi:hypothetical protein
MKQKRRILLDSFGEENKKRFSLLSPGIIVPCTHLFEPRLKKEQRNLEYASVGQQMGLSLSTSLRAYLFNSVREDSTE